jgi:hypothetical protein
MTDEGFDGTCVGCMETDETEFVVTSETGGAVGIYCWTCETLYVDESVVHGDVEVM